MSKDFEQAYRELAESEIPDLWDRIEAGLESKSTPERIEGREAAEETVTVKNQHRKRKWIHFNRYSGIVAAAICVAVVLPAAVFLFMIGSWRSGRNGSGAPMTAEGIDTAAQDEALEFAADDAADEEESCETASEEMDAGGMAGALEESAEPAEKEEGSTMSAAQSSMQDTAQDATAKKEAVEMSNTAKTEEETGGSRNENETADAGADGSSSSLREIREGTVFEHVVIKVTEVQNDFEREDGSLPGTFYTVAIQSDASGHLEEGEELVVDVPADSSLALPEDGVFEVDLIYRGNGIYGLEEYHQQVDQ